MVGADREWGYAGIGGLRGDKVIGISSSTIDETYLKNEDQIPR